MILCDYCIEYYHPHCVGITVEQAQLFDSYKCPTCIEQNIDEPIYEGAITLKLIKKNDQLYRMHYGHSN